MQQEICIISIISAEKNSGNSKRHMMLCIYAAFTYLLTVISLLIKDLDSIKLMPTYSLHCINSLGYHDFSFPYSATLNFCNHTLHWRECHPVCLSMMRQLSVHSLGQLSLVLIRSVPVKSWELRGPRLTFLTSS